MAIVKGVTVPTVLSPRRTLAELWDYLILKRIHGLFVRNTPSEESLLLRRMGKEWASSAVKEVRGRDQNKSRFKH